MKKVKFICPRCGSKFTVEADYVMPGIEGFCNNVKFVDPTTPRECSKCFEEMFAEVIAKREE